MDFLLIPINLKNSHWSLVVVEIKNLSIIYVDSLKGSRNKNADYIVKILIKLLNKYIQDKKEIENKNSNGINIYKNDNDEKFEEEINSTISNEMKNLEISNFAESEEFKCSNLIQINKDLNIDFSDWKVFISEAPYQTNMDDCGIFLCKFMDYVCRNKQFDFTNEEILYFRKLIAIEIINGDLLTN